MEECLLFEKLLKRERKARLILENFIEIKSRELFFMHQELEAAKINLEEKVKMRTKDLEDANERLKESTVQLVQSGKLATLGELGAGIIHELVQPLSCMKLNCQMMVKDMRKGVFDKCKTTDDMDEIIKQILKMEAIINHMRIFTRRADQHMDELIDVNLIVENTFIFLRHKLKEHVIKIYTNLDSGLPKIKGQAIPLEQVFINLIGNAQHALEKSEKTEKRIDITTFTDNDKKNIIIEFKDNGEGISVDLKAKIFEAFFTTKDSARGTGLGLSVSKKIIESHKGRIEVESTLGEGAIFRIVLPIFKRVGNHKNTFLPSTKIAKLA